jgi:hypothetical protein
MGSADGRIIGTTKIVNNGDNSEHWNLVIVSEGYREDELSQFAIDAQSFVDVLATTQPFDSLMSAINVHRIDVASTDSGADNPAACGGDGSSPATFFDASFCNSNIQRLLVVDSRSVINVVNARVRRWGMILVIVNSKIYGGSGGGVAVFSLAEGANEIALHEMGHTAFGLADEYESFAGCGRETNHDHHPAKDPAEPNVTVKRDRTEIKWRDLIDTETPIPTTSNPDCSQCDPQKSPVAAETIGAFEGANHFHCGAYRPAFNCRMRTLGQPFCLVCQQRILETISPFLPSPGP